jgi:hypothetical protein
VNSACECGQAGINTVFCGRGEVIARSYIPGLIYFNLRLSFMLVNGAHLGL